jgi:hypothetical protein
MFKKKVTFFGRPKSEMAPIEPGRYGALSQAELLSMAYTPLDAGLLKAAIHVIRAEGSRASISLAGAGRAGLTDSQVREECGALAAASRIENDLLLLVAEANKRRQ